MTEQTWWALAIVAVLLAAAIGFFVGRQTGGTKKRISELESEMSRQQDEIAGYKREVEAHFDQTATLFVSMAGSYKNLFEHLSSGYEKLSAGSARDLFKKRFAAVLLEGAGGDKMLAEGGQTEAAEGRPETPAESAADEREAPAGGEAEVASAAGETEAAVKTEAAGGAAAASAEAAEKPGEATADEAPKEDSAEPAAPRQDDPAAAPGTTAEATPEYRMDEAPAPTEDAVRDLSGAPSETKPRSDSDAR